LIFCLHLILPPRPPSSTLFPYTTLFRSLSEPRPTTHACAAGRIAVPDPARNERRGVPVGALPRRQGVFRSRICDRAAGRDASGGDRKSTRLNSSHEWISYAVFCLKKKNK